MVAESVPLSLIQVATELHLLCAQCERRMPFVVYFHHIAEVHDSSRDGESVRQIIGWVDSLDSKEARMFLGMLTAVYARWKVENPE